MSEGLGGAMEKVSNRVLGVVLAPWSEVGWEAVMREELGGVL